ncbi:MAG: hypoxanthine phosphoribosyltransferase [Armatimonadetes bacterium]|nr:hypoxanthine phosphoribosyltransferase [Armatimonadota bacterium]
MQRHLEVLLSEEKIQARVKELAEEVGHSIPTDNLLLVGILKGSVYFLTDFSRALSVPHEIDFMRVSSYEGESSRGVVQILKDLESNIEGRNVLIVEDVVDSGLTLSHLMEMLQVRGPKSLNVVTLLSKALARGKVAESKFVGFEIPDQFVVGYGLDLGEAYRHLPYIATFSHEASTAP